jgi:hypothetical protein
MRPSASLGDGRTGGVDPQSPEDLAGHRVAGDERGHLAPAPAGGALQNVLLEYSLQKRGPIQTASALGHGRRPEREGVEAELVSQRCADSLLVQAGVAVLSHRLAAEDYSPCQRNQVPYSAPDLVTGDGTEVLATPPPEGSGFAASGERVGRRGRFQPWGATRP